MRFALIALIGLAACGREGNQFLGIASSPSPTPLPTLEVTTPTPSASPEASESPTPSPEESESPSPEASAAPAPGGGNSGINGTVKAGPTCPVEQESSPCPERNVAGAEVTAKNRTTGTVTTTTADGNGRFTMQLDPANYDVTAKSDSVMSCDTEHVTVHEHSYTPVVIDCDTGIR